ncbi:MAG TPA: TetR family transcriptional regulator [Streptosporangiaceae bacterium]|nr:TetR family transcriptional regulator [Streptosporangiaceae bacterium]
MTARPAGRSGRRAGDSKTSEAILEAARGQFAEHGYNGATIRAIAARAQVDPALVHHFYGTKEALFAAAMRLPVVPSEVLSAALASKPGDRGLGELIVRTALTLWETDGVRETFLGLLRSAVTSEDAAIMLREFVAESILGTLVRIVDVRGTGAEVEYRAGMVATQMVGLGLTRLVLGLPAVAQASVDELAATIGPSVERYLTGEIKLPDRFAG